MAPTPPTYHLRVLGCPKNQVDGGYLEGLMEGGGHTPVAEPENADTVIVPATHEPDETQIGGWLPPAVSAALNGIRPGTRIASGPPDTHGVIPLLQCWQAR